MWLEILELRGFRLGSAVVVWFCVKNFGFARENVMVSF